jgi:pyridoxal phosphate enzyme (YggS family)
MINIAENIARARSELPAGVRLLAATKTQSDRLVREAIAAGADACGENRVQEMTEKNALGAYAGAPLHFIGHLQRNKLKQVVGLCELIESVDSFPLLQCIDARAKELGTVQSILLEINIADEPTKTGISAGDLSPILEQAAKCGNILIKGLMAIPPVSAPEGGNRAYFAAMYKLFVDIGSKKYDNTSMRILSMGMSGDYKDAASEGANLVRLGTAIFGLRG